MFWLEAEEIICESELPLEGHLDCTVGYGFRGGQRSGVSEMFRGQGDVLSINTTASQGPDGISVVKCRDFVNKD